MAAPLQAPSPDEQAQLREKAIEEYDLRQTLLGYLNEAREARRSGTSDRESNWSANWDAYWMIYETSKKATWQSQEQMPEVPMFVERFTASMRQALVKAGDFFVVSDPMKGEDEVTEHVRKIVKAMLSRSGRNATGHRIGFSHEFGKMMKSGALMAVCAMVTWEDGAIRVQAIDPREVWLDPTQRGLYRIRERKIDRHKLKEMAKKKDSAGKPLYNQEAIRRLEVSMEDDLQTDKDTAAGHTQEISSARKPVVLHEFLCTILDRDGETVKKNQVVVMANEREIIRGPEPNPFWHQRDWIVYAPMINVPFSVYGRSYAETFRQLANTYTEMSNLLLDAIMMSSINAFLAWPEALEDPSQLDEGVTPAKVFKASEDWDPGQDFLKKIQLGQVPPEAYSMLNAVKTELQEGAAQSELAIGHLPSSGEHSATAVAEASSGSRALLGAVATDTEEQALDPILDLVWWTTLQNLDPEEDPELAEELGPEVAAMLVERRESFKSKRFRLRSTGLSGMLERADRLRGVLGFLNVIGANDILAQAFMKEYSLTRLIAELMTDFGVDKARLEKTEQEILQEAMERVRAAGAAPGGAPGQPGAAGAGGSDLAKMDPTAPPGAAGGGMPEGPA